MRARRSCGRWRSSPAAKYAPAVLPDAPPRDLPRLAASLTRVRRLLELPEERLRMRTPASGWCALEHLFHVVLANDMSLKNALHLVQGRGRLRTPLPAPGERDPRADAILARGRLPHGTQAPRFVTPPPRPDVELARAILAETQTAAASPELAAGLDAAEMGIPHQALGVLSAAEWVRFARMHSAHHLRLVATVLAAAR
jgi:hypothetical protein